MKAIFLDIDGVINSYGDTYDDPENDTRLYFSNKKLMMVDDICQSCDDDVFMVITSTWRIGRSLKEFRFWFRRLGCWHYNNFDFTKRILTDYVKTKKHDFEYKNCHFRGEEVREWLSRHPEIDGYVIIDDDGDFYDDQRCYLVQTDCMRGIQDSDVKKAISILNNCKYCSGLGEIWDEDQQGFMIRIGGCPKCGGSGKAKDIREECGNSLTEEQQKKLRIEELNRE